MSVEWLTVRHSITGGETEIPKRALPSYLARGWRPLTPIADGLVPSAIYPDVAVAPDGAMNEPTESADLEKE